MTTLEPEFDGSLWFFTKADSARTGMTLARCCCLKIIHCCRCVVFGVTDVVKIRATNQDQFLVAVLFKALQVEQTSLPQRKMQHSPGRTSTAWGQN
jgi:hypothetical protein